MEPIRVLVVTTDVRRLWSSPVGLGAGFDAVTVRPAEADAAADALRPQVVLADVSEGAVGLLEEFRERHAGVEFVFVYPGGTAADAARALREGAWCCLPAPADVEVLRASVARCVRDASRRRAARREADAVARDLGAAWRLQRAMFPAADVRVAGFSAGARWMPSDQLRGDLADYAPAGAGGLALLVADVAGHGVAAALLTTVVKSAFCAAAASDYAPAQVVANVAAGLRPFGAERFVTLVAARLRRAGPGPGGPPVLEYVNAGHPPGWVLSRGRVAGLLEPTGPLVSPALDDAGWDVATIDLPPDSGVLLYTDGVTDAEGDGGRFGEAGLADSVSRHRGGGAALLDGILASVRAFANDRLLRDDVTLLTATVGLPGLG